MTYIHLFLKSKTIKGQIVTPKIKSLVSPKPQLNISQFLKSDNNQIRDARLLEAYKNSYRITATRENMPK